MAIDYSAIVRTTREWLATASGLPEGKVILENQSGPELEPPYATVKLGVVRKPFPQDYRGQAFDAGAPVGEEVTTYATGPRLISMSVSVYTKGTTGNTAAIALLAAARDALELEAVRLAFAAAGAAVVDASEVRDLSLLLFTNFQGRAHLELTLSVASYVSEVTGYIATVSGQGTVSNGDGTPIATIPFDAYLE